jgi:hypothetical protein
MICFRSTEADELVEDERAAWRIYICTYRIGRMHLCIHLYGCRSDTSTLGIGWSAFSTVRQTGLGD